MPQIVALVWAVLVISAQSRRNLAVGDLSAMAAKVACVFAVSLAMSLWAPSTGAMIVTAMLAIQGLIVGAVWLMDLRQQGIAKRRPNGIGD